MGLEILNDGPLISGFIAAIFQFDLDHPCTHIGKKQSACRASSKSFYEPIEPRRTVYQGRPKAVWPEGTEAISTSNGTTEECLKILRKKFWTFYRKGVKICCMNYLCRPPAALLATILLSTFLRKSAFNKRYFSCKCRALLNVACFLYAENRVTLGK